MSAESRSSKPLRRGRFVERSLQDIDRALEQSLFAERIAGSRGLLQVLDPRLKIVSVFLLLISVNLSHSLLIIALLYFLTLGLAFFSKVPLGFFIKRVWLFIPFFTAVIALPALFTTPGPVGLHLPLGLVTTRTGAMTTLFLLLRVGTSVSIAVLLILTTPWNSLLKALGALRVPSVIILILGMTYRYIHLLLNLTNDMFLSRKSRVLRPMTGGEERHLVAATSGALLSKSLQVSSDVYLAMQSRGFRDYPRTIDTFQIQTVDWVSATVMLVLVVLSIWLGR
ncbi:MAG: cobalt ECF transporter T component CbiQ [Anaerolineales bacterium]